MHRTPDISVARTVAFFYVGQIPLPAWCPRQPRPASNATLRLIPLSVQQLLLDSERRAALGHSLRRTVPEPPFAASDQDLAFRYMGALDAALTSRRNGFTTAESAI